MARRTHGGSAEVPANRVRIALHGGRPLTITVREGKIMKRQPASRHLSVWISPLLALTLGAFLGAGCATVPPGQMSLPTSAPTSASAITEINNSLTAAALQNPAASPDYRLGPEDLLQITLYNIPAGEVGVTPRTMEVRVSQEGKITLPLLGDIPVAGLTTAGLEQWLRGGYEKYLHNPAVGVQVKEYRSQPVTMMGAVKNPGVYQLTSPKTLIDMLSLAGGVSERAGGQVHLYRQGPEGRQSYIIDLLALTSNPTLVNMPVQAGDVVNVQQAGMFFVDGAVARPGSYPLNHPYTLTQALSVAGGVNRELADYGGTTIYRRRNGAEADRIPIDLSAIWAAKTSDLQIEADDVIVVPISTPKYLVRRFLGTIGLGSVTQYPGL
jgi:polysaccharide biosynthesis/export protein